MKSTETHTLHSMSPASIRTDGGTQSRAAINLETVEEYAAAMEQGAKFPPVVAFNDGADYWLGDGFHRLAAAIIAGLDVDVDVRQGTRRDAVLHSVGANSVHGLRRTNDDKRRAVTTLLTDPEWSRWSNREIGRKARVSETLVRNIRKELDHDNPTAHDAQLRTYTRNGQAQVMNVANVGLKHQNDHPNSTTTPPPSQPQRSDADLGRWMTSHLQQNGITQESQIDEIFAGKTVGDISIETLEEAFGNQHSIDEITEALALAALTYDADTKSATDPTPSPPQPQASIAPLTDFQRGILHAACVIIHTHDEIAIAADLLVDIGLQHANVSSFTHFEKTRFAKLDRVDERIKLSF